MLTKLLAVTPSPTQRPVPSARYSLVQSCALIHVSLFDYLRDVLLRVATHPQHRIAELTPNGWVATFGRRIAA